VPRGTGRPGGRPVPGFRRRTVPRPAPASSPSPGRNASARPVPLTVSGRRHGAPLGTRHRCTLPVSSSVHTEAARTVPVGLNATRVTDAPTRPIGRPNRDLPLVTFQTPTPPSSEPAATSEPSGLNATLKIQLPVFIVTPVGRRVLASQIRTTPS